ncbi:MULTISPECIES: GTP 3',8-cyclase MoaA [Pseudomonas]|uniref:radical SAM protein n=1 Tax=Pseudomonas TaxID=286 RepID=UPI001473F22C|nr:MULTISPECIES: GTP 3',8-cyclase MoaA [Pseudomonas]MCU0211240.1 radical SAM protein [Pseudomonas shahriarae]NMY21357.1 radical SAM protein [Pseudomonas sp. WS 5410]
MKNNISPYHLRFFLVPHCNLRCVYCNPDAEAEDRKLISFQDIKDVMSIASVKGVDRVHYSGGEPTLRKEISSIFDFARDKGFVEQAMTTNGLTLEKKVKEYFDCGLTRLNISLDSLNGDLNKKITGVDCLTRVLKGIDKSLNYFDRIKLNVVIMRRNIQEVEHFIEMSNRYNGKVIVRFIELQSNQPVFFTDRMKGEHIPMSEVESIINEKFGTLRAIAIPGENPNCSYFSIEGSKALIGEIANHSKGYPCGGCHKIRISPYGDLGVCINAEGINVRNMPISDKEAAIEKLFFFRSQLDVVAKKRRHLSDSKGFWRWGDLSNSTLKFVELS